jgi:hypothetical protein
MDAIKRMRLERRWAAVFFVVLLLAAALVNRLNERVNLFEYDWAADDPLAVTDTDTDTE